MSNNPDFAVMSKEELEEFAVVRGIRIDKRQSKDKMAAAILDEVTAPVVLQERQAESFHPDPMGDVQPQLARGPIDEKKDAAAEKAMPDERLQELVQGWAGGLTGVLESVHGTRVGNDLVITMTTKHGDSRGAAGDVTWTDAGVKAALDAIQKQLS